MKMHYYLCASTSVFEQIGLSPFSVLIHDLNTLYRLLGVITRSQNTCCREEAHSSVACLWLLRPEDRPNQRSSCHVEEKVRERVGSTTLFHSPT